MIQIILLDNGVRVANIDYPNNHLVFGVERTNIIEIFDSGKKVVSAPYTEFINELGQPFLTPQSVITTLELSYLNLVSQEELDIEISDRIAADTVLSNRTTILENNEYKILYFETISASTGTITKPTNSTIILDQFYSGGDAIVETLVNGQPSGQSPLTSSGSVVSVSSFDVNGNYTLSSTPSSFDVALLYILKIKAIDYGNLTYDNIIETVNLNDITKFSYTDTVLGTATSGTGNQFSKSVLIPANTVSNGALNIKGRAKKSGSSSYGWLNIYVNSANNLTGAKHLGQINSAGGNTLANFAIDRTIPIQSNSFVTFIVNTTNGFEEIVTNQVSTATIDWTVDQYVILSCQCNMGTDTMQANFLSVNQF